ncbi:antibiotic biosynthesis monooxygenase [Pseudonocardia sp. NPDC046786]|uniref:putative quinol monooxygenase n=1 Tax=Pseudonocardia sp. NPDC046786 TaxID=3155471 RepID=UPI0033DC969D
MYSLLIGNQEEVGRMGQVAQVARFVAKQDAVEPLLAALDDASAAAAGEPGTLVYVTHVERDAPHVLWVYELYADDEAHAAHSGSEATARLRAALAETLAEPPTVTQAVPRRQLGVPAS